MQHHRSEPATRALFDGDQRPMMARQLHQQRQIQRLGETRIGNGRRKTEAGELIRGRKAFRQPCPEREQSHG